jgi:transcriptional regulator of acetoin/glycerol metabolism
MRRVLRNLLLGRRGSMEQVAEIVTIHRCTFNHRMRGHGLTPH